MGLNLPDGGHLTHGWKVSATAQFYNSVPYHVKPNGKVDLEEVKKLAREHKPKLIWVGATAYVYEYEFAEFAKIADSVGAYLAADIAHIAGLVAGGVHPSPVPHVHIVTTTTHKTLRGPRGGMIMVTQKGLDKDPELSDKVDKAIFPGLQGGPHDHTTAAIAVALKEAATPAFTKYAQQIVKNSKMLAQTLMDEGLTLVGNGTENHLLLINLVPQLGPGGGIFVQEALDMVHMTLNKNTIPADPSSPYYPSGVRLGTPAATSRGMKEADMKKVGKWIARVVAEVSSYRLPADKEARATYLTTFRKDLSKNKNLRKIAKEVTAFCKKFPLP
jgi:glycine hydroxymethyltransferase